MQALVESHYSIEMFWYPLNSASAKGFNATAWDSYADRLMVYQTLRAAAPAGGPAPRPYSSKPNVAANLETYLGAVATNVGVTTGNLAVQVQPRPGFRVDLPPLLAPMLATRCLACSMSLASPQDRVRSVCRKPGPSFRMRSAVTMMLLILTLLVVH